MKLDIELSDDSVITFEQIEKHERREPVLAEYGDKNAIQKLESARGPVRDNLTRLALPFGRLRWLSTRENSGLSFKKLTPFRFIKPDWSFDAGGLMSKAAAQLKETLRVLDAKLTALPDIDPWLACQRHDLLAILALAIGLDKGGVLGSRNPGSDNIASMLRASLDSAHWLTSHLATDIRCWEAANPPFKVLSNA